MVIFQDLPIKKCDFPYSYVNVYQRVARKPLRRWSRRVFKAWNLPWWQTARRKAPGFCGVFRISSDLNIWDLGSPKMKSYEIWWIMVYSEAWWIRKLCVLLGLYVIDKPQCWRKALTKSFLSVFSCHVSTIRRSAKSFLSFCALPLG